MRLESDSDLPEPALFSANSAPGPTAQAAAEPMNCRYHPKSPAGNYCSKCQRGYCSLCVSQRGAGSFCRACGGACTPLEAVAPSEIVEASFYQQIPATFAYPFKGNGVFMMAIGSILFVLINFASQFSLLIWALMIGYAALYAQGIIQASAQGDGRGPEWPDVGGSVRTALFVACFQYIATILVCFLPLLLLMLFADETQTWVGFGILGSIAVGFIYLPMALLAVGILDSVVAVNPTLLLPAIFRTPAACVTTLALQALLIGLAAGLEMLISTILPFLPGLVSSAFSLYFLTVSVRLLGVFYHSNRYQIGWVNHS